MRGPFARAAAFVLLLAAAALLGLLGVLNARNAFLDYRDRPTVIHGAAAVVFFVLAVLLGWAALRTVRPGRR